MAFKANNIQILNFDDKVLNLSDRDYKFLRNTWAETFSNQVFPAIDEQSFKCLYSSNDASRPSTPVNYVIGALLIKEMFHLSDEETVETIRFDIRAQYALHGTSYETQPISDRTMSRFRARILDYEEEHGVNLLEVEMKRLASVFAEDLQINGKVVRMDSLMIASHAKALSRLELIYTTVAKCIKLFEKEHNEEIPESLKHYLEKDDINKVIYYSKDDEVTDRLQTAVTEAYTMKELMNLHEEYIGCVEYELLLRLLNEQTTNGKPKENNEITADSMQSPNDPDATYRKKAGEDYKGYVGNITESIGENGASVISDFDFQTNNYPDQKFSEDFIEKNEDKIAIADGAYGSVELQEKAKEKNIQLVTTALSGKDPDPIFSDFQINEEGTQILSCPNGNQPMECTYNENNETVRVKMDINQCKNCPFKERCRVKFQKKSAIVTVSKKMVARAGYIKLLGTEEMKKLTTMRNAVEGVMSVLRRRYRIDEIPVFGKKRMKTFFVMKIGAFNVVKLIRHYEENESLEPVMA